MPIKVTMWQCRHLHCHFRSTVKTLVARHEETCGWSKSGPCRECTSPELGCFNIQPPLVRIRPSGPREDRSKRCGISPGREGYCES